MERAAARRTLWGTALSPKSLSGGRSGPVPGPDDWAPVFYHLVELGLDPTRFGELTYPQLVALLTRGKPRAMEQQLWQARKAMADVLSGRLAWDDK